MTISTISSNPEFIDRIRCSIKTGNEIPQPEKWKGKSQKKDWFGLSFFINNIDNYDDITHLIKICKNDIMEMERNHINISKVSIIYKPPLGFDAFSLSVTVGIKFLASGRAFMINRMGKNRLNYLKKKKKFAVYRKNRVIWKNKNECRSSFI